MDPAWNFRCDDEDSLFSCRPDPGYTNVPPQGNPYDVIPPVHLPQCPEEFLHGDRYSAALLDCERRRARHEDASRHFEASFSEAIQSRRELLEEQVRCDRIRQDVAMAHSIIATVIPDPLNQLQLAESRVQSAHDQDAALEAAAALAGATLAIAEAEHTNCDLCCIRVTCGRCAIQLTGPK